MTKIRKLRRSGIIAAAYLVILAVLLTGMTTAKYTETKTVYTSFGAASFNTVLLGGDANQEIKTFSSVLSSENTVGLLPGMESLGYPFSVANGVTQANVSEVAVGYNIRLYSNGSLPLKYTLKEKSTTGEQEVTYFTKLESDQIVRDEIDGSTKWFEYGFYTDAEFTREAAFDLQGNTFEADTYELMVDWPVSSEQGSIPANSSKYMKEVEIFEVRVTVASKNMLTEENYIGSTYTIPESELYGTGLIIAADRSGAVYGTVQSYSYQVDYRAFHNEEGRTLFNFNVDNGRYMGCTHPAASTWYTIQLMVPYNDDTKDYKYNIETTALGEYNNNGTLQTAKTYQGLEQSSVEYRRYSETGEYTVLMAAPSLSGTDGAENRVMAVYTFKLPEGVAGASCGDEALLKLNNSEVNIDGTISYTNGDAHSFRIILTGTGNCIGEGTAKNAAVNRISVLINAVDSNSMPTDMTPGFQLPPEDPEEEEPEEEEPEEQEEEEQEAQKEEEQKEPEAENPPPSET